MTRILSASDQAALADVNRVIHDLWFDTAEVVHDPRERRLVVPCRRAKQRGRVFQVARSPDRTEKVAYNLIIEDVCGIKIEEREMIGIYEIEKIVFADGTIRIVTSIPLEFLVYVEGVNVRLVGAE